MTTLRPAYPRVIAHRGGGALAPENTLAALEVAARHGCRAVELDARLSADGTPFLIHDATLDRTTTGTGLVSATGDGALRTLDAGRRFSAAFAGEPLPTLGQAIQRCGELGLWANIEIKAEAGAAAATGSAVARVVASGWRGPMPVVVSSFSPVALEAARRAVPALPRALLFHGLPRNWLARAERLDCVAIHCAARRVRADQIVAVRQAGYVLACFTVDEPDLARRLLAAGVNAIFTDRPDLIGDDSGGT